jgi:predicted ester cyclase
MPPGPDAVLRAFEMVRRAFPDLSVKVEAIVAEGDLVAVRGTWTGTHKGPFPPMNLPPTNRHTTPSGMVFWRIRDGQIVERWGNLDRLGLQRQFSAES